MLTAAARAAHREGPPPWILDDPFAAMLAGDGGAAMLDRVRSQVSPDAFASFVTWVCLRGRFTEDLVAEASRDGIRQYVMIGAGLDSSAYRHPEWEQLVAVFEVDHEASQAWKRSTLDTFGIATPANVVFAAVDLEHETLHDGLLRAGLDFTAPAVVSWIGVTMYLTADAISATLNDVAALGAGTRLVMTYNRPLQAVDAFSREVTSAIGAAVADGGEPFVSLYEPDDARELLGAHGFVDVRDFGSQDLKQRYLRAGAGVMLADAQRLLVGSARKR